MPHGLLTVRTISHDQHRH